MTRSHPKATSERAVMYGGARFTPVAHNSKLAKLRLIPTDGRPRPVPLPPYISSTDVSIDKTCGDCPFQNGGCWAQAGFTKFTTGKLNAGARRLTAKQVIQNEVRLIDEAFGGGLVRQDGARGGRDLRLHNGGDAGSEAGAQLLAAAADRWFARRGGRVFTFTHLWRTIPRSAFGRISVLASVERPEDIERAHARGYAAAIVVEKFPKGHRDFDLSGSSNGIVPCPAETETPTRAARTCVECRLCMDANALLRRNVSIAFEAHGPEAKQVREVLVRLRRAKGEP